MPTILDEQTLSPSLDTAQVRQQLKRLVQDDHLRPSRRSVAFLRYIVEESLGGRAEELKERTIGVHVFGKPLTYDTNADHVVRTAASELRKRLSLYYGKDEHRDELRILLLPGSYMPHFHPSRPSASPLEPVEDTNQAPDEPAVPVSPGLASAEPDGTSTADRAVPDRALDRNLGPIALWAGLLVLACLAGFAGLRWQATRSQPTAQQLFWEPMLESSGPVLIAIGDVPHGPPLATPGAAGTSLPTPAGPGAPTVPFADAVAIARISGVLAANGKDFVIRRENASSFADLRERPTVLVGAFNNEWSLRLTRHLRFSLALDADRRLLYIRDRDHPDSRAWQWSTDPHPEEKNRSEATPLHDYSLISRVLDSETGHDVMVLGGLYTYGTQAAGEFVASPQAIAVSRAMLQDRQHKTLQIVLDTLVTDGSAGPPRIVAMHQE